MSTINAEFYSTAPFDPNSPLSLLRSFSCSLPFVVVLAGDEGELGSGVPREGVGGGVRGGEYPGPYRVKGRWGGSREGGGWRG